MLREMRRDREEHVDASRRRRSTASTTNCHGANCDPKPLQSPHPPIWIGGGGEQLTLRVVARHADYSNFGGVPRSGPASARSSRRIARRSAVTRRDRQDVVAGDVHPLDRGRAAGVREPQPVG